MSGLPIELFELPTQHPYGMLEGFHLAHANEAESTLAWALRKCIEAGAWASVPLLGETHELISLGLLENGEEPETYAITEKGKGLLYSVYHKKE